ncbi:hypothetical protein CR513_06345, partial [Mucuna pruriens]
MILRDNGKMESDSSRGDTFTSSDSKICSDDSHVEGDLLMVRRLMGNQVIEEAKTHRENIFHSRCHVLGMTVLLKEFKDMFPNDIPLGLPPLRRIKHHIDLCPRASIPNKAAY